MANSTEQFELSDEQKAILASKGNTMVVSNPGTGKTTTLGLKVMDLLESGVDPEEILCITYTEKAKKEMYEAIREISDGYLSRCGVYGRQYLHRQRPQLYGQGDRRRERDQDAQLFRLHGLLSDNPDPSLFPHYIYLLLAS